jgi:hypothetical protein
VSGGHYAYLNLDDVVGDAMPTKSDLVVLLLIQ